MSILALVALTACGPSAERAAPSTTSSTSSTSPVAAPSPTSSTTSSSSAPASPSKAATPALPKGYRWRTIEKVHTTFAAPDSWTAIDPAQLGKISADSPEIQKLAARMGVSSSQVAAFLSQVDLYLAGPPVKGYSPNIQAVVLPLAELPSDAALSTQLGRAAIRKPTLRHQSTPVGEVVTAGFSMKVGTKVVVARSLYFDTDEGILNLTVGAPDDRSADRLAATVLRSVHAS